MQNKKKLYSMNKLYIIFFSTVLFINFFFINSLKANVFKVTDIEITEPFELNFNREEVIDKGFRRAFIQLISTLVSSYDKEKIKNKIILLNKEYISKDIFSNLKSGSYFYSGGWQIKGVYSMFIGFIFAASTIWNIELRFLQSFAWLIGAFISYLTYYVHIESYNL